MPRYFDIHSHIPFRDYDQDLEEVVSRMRDEEVWTITVGVDHKTSKEAVLFGEEREGFFASIGLHPTGTPLESFHAREYTSLVEHPKTVAIGECGIDYYRLQGAGGSEQQKEKERQWGVFKQHIEFALEYDKPLMIHCRPSKGSMDAYEEVAGYLESLMLDVRHQALRGNMHFFVGNVDVARRFWRLGFTTSFTGVLTFTHDYDEVVREAPLDMILTETDSPFAAPQPFRGKRNEPVYVKYVVEAIAKARRADVESIREATVSNAFRVFGINS